jgi:hypothetical protein
MGRCVLAKQSVTEWLGELVAAQNAFSMRENARGADLSVERSAPRALGATGAPFAEGANSATRFN